MTFALVEKKNHHALHGLFDCKERAERHLKETIPEHIAKGYFIDKTLKTEDFEIIEWNKPFIQKRRK